MKYCSEQLTWVFERDLIQIHSGHHSLLIHSAPTALRGPLLSFLSHSLASALYLFPSLHPFLPLIILHSQGVIVAPRVHCLMSF